MNQDTQDNDTTETDDTPRPGTTHPHLARERALKVLFAADVRKVDPRVLLDEVSTRPADLELLDELEPDQEQVAGDEELQLELTRRRRLPLDDYTRTLVRGVATYRPSIDALLDDVADRWPVHRMPAVDRNLLRMAVYELAEENTPHPVVIDEGIALAIAFAGEKARGFVNGVLETVRQRIVAGEVDLQPAPEPVEEPEEPAELDTAADAAGVAPNGDERPTPTAEDVEEDLTTEALDEVDEAASAAYDLALDLLDAEGPLEESPTEGLEEPHVEERDLEGSDLGNPALEEPSEGGDEVDDGWTSDFGEPSADAFSLDDLEYLDDLEQLTESDEDAVTGSEAPEPADDGASDEDAAGDAATDADARDEAEETAASAAADEDEADLSELRDEDDALW